MKDLRVGSRYAKSMLELAIEQSRLEEVFNDMKLILDTCRNSREFNTFLKSPVVSADKKEAVVKEVFEGQVNSLTLGYMTLLIKKGREQYLEQIAVSFIEQYKKLKNIVTAKVTTATPLDNELRKRFTAIVSKLTGAEVELQETVDPEVIGGFILKVGDRQIDSSISGKLEELRSEFNRNPYVKDF